MQVQALTSIGRTLEIIDNYKRSEPVSTPEVVSGFNNQRVNLKLNYDKSIRTLPLPKVEKTPDELLHAPQAVLQTVNYNAGLSDVGMQEGNSLARNHNSVMQWTRNYAVSIYQSMQNFGKRAEASKMDLVV